MDRILPGLYQDAGLSARLGGIWQAGQIEDYYPLITRLGLENWFCAAPDCLLPIVQRKTGRSRKTCSRKCWDSSAKQAESAGKTARSEGSPAGPSVPGSEGNAIPDAAASRGALIQLMRPINFPWQRSDWSRPNIQSRDRALLLLGFTCPAPVTPSDLSDLDIHDTSKNPCGPRNQAVQTGKPGSTLRHNTLQR